MGIKDDLKLHKIVCDGAFGTYYSTLTEMDTLPEYANLENPELVKKIHKEYIIQGARLIRTNTFAANTKALGCTLDELVRHIKAGYTLAQEATQESSHELDNEKVYIAGDIGPISMKEASKEEIQKEYELICDTFLELGAEILVFETFSNLEIISEVIQNIKKKKDVFIITQFCINQYGYSASGLSAKRLLELASQERAIDAIGFNCGVGPSHLYNILGKLNLSTDKYLTALPNASYPKLSQNRMVFMENVEYFGQKVKEIASLGIDFIGGCCGTNPKYIAALTKEVDLSPVAHNRQISVQSSDLTQEKKWLDANKKHGEKILAVELSPPPNADYEKIMDAANVLKQRGVDILTFPDSPSGRMRADSILMSVKVANEAKMRVMPHICCRDRNAIAIRSALLGAHINGVKDVLVITGDPVPAMVRENVKSVFNFDSVGIMKTIQEMNEEHFKEDPMIYGGALNYNRRNIEIEIKRMEKKIAAGAKFFLSQPIFTSEDAEKLRQIKERVDTKILCGIMPLVSRRNASFIKNEMADIHVTDEIVNLFAPDLTKEEGEKIGVGIAREMIEATKDFVDGYYFSIPFNRVYLLEQILK